jgi:hypothetical protein
MVQISAPGPLAALGLRTPKIGYFDLERTGTQRFQADPIAGNSWDRWSGGSYGLVYSRTALVFHDLEQRLGGDVLARAFAEYYRRWHFRHPSTADLEAVLAEFGGETVRAWFREQVHDRAPVDDRVDAIDVEEMVPRPGTFLETGGIRAEVDEGQAREKERQIRDEFRRAHPKAKSGEPGPFLWRSTVKLRRYAAAVPQSVVVRFDDGTAETVQWAAGGRWQRWVFEKPVRVASVQIDPDRKVLLDLNKLDDGRTRERAPAASRRWTMELKAWVELLLAMVGAL